MDYVINIAKRASPCGTYHCRVDVGTDRKHAKLVHKQLQVAFPPKDYSLVLTGWEKIGTTIEESVVASTVVVP